MSRFYLSAIWSYIVQMLPCMLLAAGAFFLIRPWRKWNLTFQGLISGLYRESALFLFVLFCAGLGSLTLFPQGFWRWNSFCLMLQAKHVFALVDLSFQLQRIQWIPFLNMLNSDGPIGWGLFMLLGNIIMFSPLGFFVALLWRHPCWQKSLLAGFCSSFLVEIIQFFVGRGSDINDVILNSLGALCGFWLFCVLRQRFPILIKKFQCSPIGGPI